MSDVERRTAADLADDDVVSLTRNGRRQSGDTRQFHTGNCQAVRGAIRVVDVTKQDLEKRPATYVECANSACGDTKSSVDHGRTGTIEILESLDPDDLGGETA